MPNDLTPMVKQNNHQPPHENFAIESLRSTFTFLAIMADPERKLSIIHDLENNHATIVETETDEPQVTQHVISNFVTVSDDTSQLTISNLTPEQKEQLTTITHGLLNNGVQSIILSESDDSLTLDTSKLPFISLSNALGDVEKINPSAEDLAKTFNTAFLSRTGTTLMNDLTGYSKHTSMGSYEWKSDGYDDLHIELSEQSARGLKTALTSTFGIGGIITEPENQPKHLPNGAQRLRLTIKPSTVNNDVLEKMHEEAKNAKPFMGFRKELLDAIAAETSASHQR